MTIRGEKSPRQRWRCNYYKKNKKRIRENQIIYMRRYRKKIKEGKYINRIKSYGKINSNSIDYFNKSYDNKVEFLHESTTVYFD